MTSVKNISSNEEVVSTTTLEKARKVRNLYNQWVDHSRTEAVIDDKRRKLAKELESATYSKNGYEHFKVLGAALSKNEAEGQMEKLVRKQERELDYLKRIEAKLEGLL